MNAGKRNVSVDLKAPGAPDIIARLAARADVLIENFRPGVLARFGLDAATLRAANPRLVYCSITGWGQDGPWRHRRAYAPLVHADTGVLELAGRLRGRRPEPEVHQHGDVYTAIVASNAVLAALVQRGITGEGQHLDVAMGQAALYVNEWAAVALQPPADEWGGFDTWHHHTYPLGDGSYVALVGNPVRMFPAWVRCLSGSEALLSDPRFATEAARAAHIGEMVRELDALTGRCADFAALEACLEPAMLAAQLRSVGELAQTDWALHRRAVAEVAPGVGVPAAPWQSDGARIGATARVAALGEDTYAVLTELGYSPTQITALHRTGALVAAVSD